MTGVADVSEALDGLTEPCERVRTTGVYIEGIYKKNVPVTMPMEAVVQPVSGADAELVNVVDGARRKRMRKFFTITPLHASDNTDVNKLVEADIVTHNGTAYKILNVDDWSFVGGIYIAIGEEHHDGN